jgi:hypothetical protein
MGRNNVTIRKHRNGADVWLRVVFFDRNYDESDPDTIDLTIELPDGTTIAKTKADMEQWSEVDGSGNPVQTGHWQYKHTNTQNGHHKFTAVSVMANGDNGVEVGRWKVI